MDAHCQPAGQPISHRLPQLWMVLLLAWSVSLAPGCRKHEPVLEDLGGLDQFKARFSEEEGRPRIVLLLSPT